MLARPPKKALGGHVTPDPGSGDRPKSAGSIICRPLRPPAPGLVKVLRAGPPDAARPPAAPARDALPSTGLRTAAARGGDLLGAPAALAPGPGSTARKYWPGSRCRPRPPAFLSSFSLFFVSFLRPRCPFRIVSDNPLPRAAMAAAPLSPNRPAQVGLSPRAPAPARAGAREPGESRAAGQPGMAAAEAGEWPGAPGLAAGPPAGPAGPVEPPRPATSSQGRRKAAKDKVRRPGPGVVLVRLASRASPRPAGVGRIPGPGPVCVARV